MFMHYLASYLLDDLELARLPVEMESFENMFSYLWSTMKTYLHDSVWFKEDKDSW